MSSPKVAAVPLSKLHAAEWNPRTIRDERFQNLCRSIEADPDFLWRRPVLAMANGTIYAGNMRFRAVEHLGLKTVPAIVEDVPERLAKERALRDNAQWGDWQEEELAELIYGMRADGSDMDLLGIEADDLAKIFASVGVGADGLTDPDEVPEAPAEPISKRGDLWLLGDHRVLCGDATSADDHARLLNGERPGCVVSDPPYGIGYSPGGGGGGHILRRDGSRYEKTFTGKDIVHGDDHPYDPSPILALGLPAILWGGNHYASRLPDSPSWLVWDKRRGTSVNDFADCEIAWSNLGSVARVFHHMWNGMLKDSERGDERLHPTQKPVAVMTWCMGMVEGDTFDPFLGSGTTLIAAEQLGRRCFGMEIEPRYVDVIVARWEAFTGKKASLA